MPTRPALIARDLCKKLGKTKALDGFDLTVMEGTVCGLLGPNGAGKTTAVRILTTLLLPDSGSATVAGFDVVREPARVRFQIGLTGQQPTVDEMLTGRENLRMWGRLYHLPARAARIRADELLEQFRLTDAADKQVRHYSGGMRRRLDLAIAFILAPRLLFLDEPTTGLDPRSRNEVWNAVRMLTHGGTTVLLTTQYLDEADQLADQIAVMAHGRVIADDTPEQLKSTLGGDQLDIVVRDAAELAAATALVERVTTQSAHSEPDTRRINAPVKNRVGTLVEVTRRLAEAGIDVADIALRRPTLDEVFLRLTADPAQEGIPIDQTKEPVG
ncbi:ATP-binding cassette domain-containing protein [Micromonospora aurantiaca]|uniref:ATP-binding cassette domain-containing protein n=1 Tax=Micromonospora aurantiaca (nom. illeg.) TaxID=47850 RepID=UPI0033EED18E